MHPDTIPEFAVVGHPNEGKSSVVSTLAEDDSVRISATPGETMVCQTFPVRIDGREIIRFTDTPGFQNPRQTLQWMQDHRGPDDRIVQQFRDSHANNPDFRDECELFAPIARGAGIIYVVDGSRPLRNVDQAEMEILRLTGRPRMAIINCKESEQRYLDQWKNAFRKHFNAVRVFNSHHATYAERIELLTSLKAIDQDWQPALEIVIAAFTGDWALRNERTADIITTLVETSLSFSVSRPLVENIPEETLRRELEEDYTRALTALEKKAQQQIRTLFRHNIFNYELPAHSILHEGLFSRKTWQLLGLSKTQLIAAAAMGGAALTGAIDILFGGASLGLFMAIGGATAAGYAAMGGAENLAKSKIMGKSLGGRQMTLGPNRNIQFLYVLLDRMLLYFAHIINWAHGRRQPAGQVPPPGSAQRKAGFTHEWKGTPKKICADFFAATAGSDAFSREQARRAFKEMLTAALQDISTSDTKDQEVTP